MPKNKIRVTESELRELVTRKVRSLIGEEPVFPSDRFVRRKSRADRALDAALLGEGLIRTYPFGWVERYLQRNANSDFKNIFSTEEEKKFQVVMKAGSKSIEPLRRTMEAFGYYCAYENYENWRGGYVMQFEPKFDEYLEGSEFSVPKGKFAFYHVAPRRFAERILRQGLVPAHKNDMFKYPDRVYLMLASEGDEAAYEMASMLYNADTNRRNDGMYSLFGVTLDGLGDVKFYRDWNIEHAEAYYTHENIPPANVTLVQSFRADLH